ncbi:hypothetical protein MTR_0007s0040 [Medicago truncatula]|uniref:Uncharacterized protein n=1 Tax=Medicago truncatula TaxID=3880 RepID=A0A072TL23_MEDTR|nr:hypothetical protein MTR_0007s0040 [Medicago truncatula]
MTGWITRRRRRGIRINNCRKLLGSRGHKRDVNIWSRREPIVFKLFDTLIDFPINVTAI